MKKVFASLAAFTLAFSVAVPAFALTTTQIQAIESLLQSFGADASVIANVDSALHGNASGNVGSNIPKCIVLNNNLYAGITDSSANGEVSKLQSFLGGLVTGYFGPQTLQLVQQWQASHSVVSSGSPDTTGYGFVGPQTRGAMGCGSQVPTPSVPTTPAATSSPSASIDQNTLSASTNGKDAGSATITGTASGVSQVQVSLDGADGGLHVAKSAVSNGHWSVILQSIFPGTHSVVVTDADFGTAYYAHTLTTGTLTMTANSGSVAVAPTCTMSASPSSIVAGQSTTITWSSQNATTAGNFIGLEGDYDVNGSAVITPGVSVTYQILFTGPGGSVTCATNITVSSASAQTNPVVIYGFAASPNTVSAGQSTTFSWNSNLTPTDVSTYGGECEIFASPITAFSALNTGQYGGSGSATYTPSATNTYTLQCFSGGKDGSPSASKTLSVTVTSGSQATTTTTSLASINSSSLSGTDSSRTIFGTASNSTYYLKVLIYSFSNPDSYVFNSQIAVDGGSWSVPLSGLANGTYEVEIHSTTGTPSSSNLLASGQFSVSQ